MNVNVLGLIRMAQAFAPVLAKNGGGFFVQLNSVASMKNFSALSTYSVSKAAAYSVTQALHDRLSEQGTRVLSVHPGPIATDMGSAAGLEDIAEPTSVVADAIVDGIRSGDYHVFPDTMARMFGDAYKGFSAEIVEANLMEG